jgi:uncharacterized protein (DUF427 family)
MIPTALRAVVIGGRVAGIGRCVKYGNHYFPADSIKAEYFADSSSHTTCPWKGEASYKTLVVEGAENADAAWYYPEPKDAAAQIKDRYAFRKGVEVSA